MKCDSDEIVQCNPTTIRPIDKNCLYPPEQPKIVAQMCEYLRNEKKNPFDYKVSIIKTCSRFYPQETTCFYCNISLEEPRRVTSKARVLWIKPLNNLVEDVQTFFRKCSKCDLCFRYQEYSDGYHNYNDTFLLTIPFCLFLRDCLQQHIPVGSISKFSHSV